MPECDNNRKEGWVRLLRFLHNISPGGDMGVVITLSFVAILLFIIFSIAALFPATWRMTDREKEKISDLKRYQEKYTSIFVIVNLVLSIFMAWLMLVIG